MMPEVFTNFVINSLSRSGAPRAIISDRGTHFCNDLFTKDFPDCEDSLALLYPIGFSHPSALVWDIQKRGLGTDNYRKGRKTKPQNDTTGSGMEKDVKDKAKSKPESPIKSQKQEDGGLSGVPPIHKDMSTPGSIIFPLCRLPSIILFFFKDLLLPQISLIPAVIVLHTLRQARERQEHFRCGFGTLQHGTSSPRDREEYYIHHD
ncbi:hypothetical protein Tco_1418382 [Tanacetum coccineum]